MPNYIKPFDAADLRKLLSTTDNKFTELSDDKWIPAFSVMELNKILHRGDYDLLHQIALSRFTPAETLKQLARDGNSDVRKAVAENPNTPSKTINQLASNGNSHIRSRVAENPRTPAKTLNQLARDGDLLIRSNVAENPSTPAETLNQLARDGDTGVRKAVARNPSTPSKTINQLARDGNTGVREAVAGNPNTPKSSCFIATAATGSYDHPITATLRGFRDEALEQTVSGRWFVEKYYHISPPLARWIAQRPSARFTIKWVFLYPLVQIIKFFSKR